MTGGLGIHKSQRLAGQFFPQRTPLVKPTRKDPQVITKKMGAINHTPVVGLWPGFPTLNVYIYTYVYVYIYIHIYIIYIHIYILYIHIYIYICIYICIDIICVPAIASMTFPCYLRAQRNATLRARTILRSILFMRPRRVWWR